MTAQTRSIVVAAMVVTDPVGRVLCVRKRGTDTFMLPGGKFEPGESVDNPEVTAAREVSEELGVDIELSQLRPWNIARAAAANEAGFEVVGHHVRYVGEFTDELANVQPHAEIEEVRWLDPWLPTGKIAPMLAETTLPKLREELPQLAAGREQPQRALSSLTVFCGSGFGNDLAWRVTAERLGQTLAKNRVELVYGGAAIGLMGTVANAALDDGGSVTGVIPEVLVKKEIAHPRLTHLETVATMADRKSRMYELGDAFVALPGGAGTLEEFFEVWTQQHLGIHAKPVALLGPSGFWEPLLALLRKVVDAGFVRPELLDALIVVDDVDKLLPALIAWRAGRTKF
ncbi:MULTISPECIES: TIGR00730 family Rossman fold protein [Corynebacterium]|uniref:TIGR00730 family Rossman fold protein n=1 Tax=Corynebacterium TaxID=1716 RepID=UPI0008A3A585|nr:MULTISPECIES: TIGR00730 family Rossman fold protein [Corynebacterium]MBC6767830.1 TIGR00730 family Rossman fold protein [Corynebacterium sp. LK15]MBC6807184.1 TIGR00730 family Rossman fold protein [Corynebacterium sp. LK30]MDK7199754.1 TIGR00730 family Rossman fold protein [Corynebacterium amycolatum]MDK8506882.1 TIGR00730 family Rossman fold protein [Corynebacterium amycolatum]OFL10412.1 NUDIX hydrolase [Corynebacterium sp. HMSC063F04]